MARAFVRASSTYAKAAAAITSPSIGTGDFTVHVRGYASSAVLTNSYYTAWVPSDGGNWEWGAKWPHLYYYDGTGGANVGATTLSTLTWYSLVYRRTGTTSEFFVNGTVDANTFTSSASVAQTNPPVIGCWRTSAFSQGWDGNICDVGVWNVSLSQAEITSLSLGNVCSRIRPASIIEAWLLTGRDSPEPGSRQSPSVGALTLGNSPAFAVNPLLIRSAGRNCAKFVTAVVGGGSVFNPYYYNMLAGAGA